MNFDTVDFNEALQAWRDLGGVIDVLAPDYKTFRVRGVLDGEDWRDTCRFALAHSNMTEEQIEEEMLACE